LSESESSSNSDLTVEANSLKLHELQDGNGKLNSNYGTNSHDEEFEHSSHSVSIIWNSLSIEPIENGKGTCTAWSVKTWRKSYISL